MKKILTLICTLLCANVLLAQTRFWVGDLQYEVTSTNPAEVMVWWYQNNPTTVNIPETVSYEGTTYSVTSIAYETFKNCSSLTSVTIPNSVTEIGYRAFQSCSSLISVTLPNNATIDESAFAYAGPFSQNDITIDNIIYRTKRANGIIGNYTFNNVGDITFYLNGNTYNLRSVEVYWFQGNPTIVNIPETINYNGATYSVTEIDDLVFYNCSNLTSITIPNSVTSVGGGVFYGCYNLTSVTLSNNITSLPAYYESGDCYGFFDGCSSLTSVTIPNSVTTIGDYAFWNCSSLSSVTIPNSVTTIGAGAFSGCSSLTSITIPNSVTTIYEGAFLGCNNLTTLNFNATNCNFNLSQYLVFPTSITTVNIGENVNKIPNYFIQSTSVSSIDIPNSVTSIGNDAFNGCTALQNITLGENVTSIGSGAFSSSSFLQNVTCLATTPPTIADNTVFPYPNIATLTVPCGTLEAYSSPTSFWNMFFMGRISEDGYEVVANVNNDTFGSVTIENNCSTATLTATANACYQFVGWNDGNTENPRIVTLSSDTTFTANFEVMVVNNDITATICEGQVYNENGFNVSEAGTYTQTLQSANGCDSIVTLVVTTYPTFDTTITATINAGETYAEFGFNESEAGTYVQNLQTEFGCDSTITLVLSVNSSLLEAEIEEISFYPNPTKDKITFSQAIENVEVIDLTGKTIFTFTNVKTINIESLPSGAYYLRLTNEEIQSFRKFIKQ